MSTPRARQPKGIPVGGQFASTAHAEAALTLTSAAQTSSTRPARPYQLEDNDDGTVTYTAGGAEMVLEHRRPATRSEMRRALSCPRSRGRVVDLVAAGGRRTSPADDIYEVNGPENGAPLVIRIRDGFHILDVLSGNVQVEVTGSFDGAPGKTLIGDGVRAGIVVDGDNEHTIVTQGTGSATIILSAASRARVRAIGTGETHVTGGGPDCRITANVGATVHQDGPEENRLPVHHLNRQPYTVLV